jgi:hypothetical protein
MLPSAGPESNLEKQQLAWTGLTGLGLEPHKARLFFGILNPVNPV